MAEESAAPVASAETASQPPSEQNDQHAQQQAAQMIQRNYRGYRERRQLQGIGLDASARWAEVNTPHTSKP